MSQQSHILIFKSKRMPKTLYKMTHSEEFDGSMLLAIKILLSYYENKMDQVFADYLYMLAIPLIFTFWIFNSN